MSNGNWWPLAIITIGIFSVHPTAAGVQLNLERIGNKDYYISGVNQKHTWFGAFEYCARHNLMLATLRSATELDNLIGKLNSIRVSSSYPVQDGFWTNGNDHAREGTFTWFNSGDTMNVHHIRWSNGRADNVGGIENCVQLYFNRTQWEWNDLTCSWKIRFICEPLVCNNSVTIATEAVSQLSQEPEQPNNTLEDRLGVAQ